MKKNIIITIIVALAVGAGSFYGGMTYAKSKNQASIFPGGNFQNRTGGQGQRLSRTGAGAGGGFVNGKVLKKDDTSLVVKMRDGSSKIVYLPDTAAVLKAEPGSKTDIAVGQNVTVTGSANQDGSLTAQSVQIRLDMANGGGNNATGSGSAGN